MSRLEEIKRLWEENNDFPVDPAEYEWLISRVAELEVENKRYKQTLESASSEMHHALYSHKSDDVKRFYVENAKRKVDKALKGESDD